MGVCPSLLAAASGAPAAAVAAAAVAAAAVVTAMSAEPELGREDNGSERVLGERGKV